MEYVRRWEIWTATEKDLPRMGGASPLSVEAKGASEMNPHTGETLTEVR